MYHTNRRSETAGRVLLLLRGPGAYFISVKEKMKQCVSRWLFWSKSKLKTCQKCHFDGWLEFLNFFDFLCHSLLFPLMLGWGDGMHRSGAGVVCVWMECDGAFEQEGFPSLGHFLEVGKTVVCVVFGGC